MRDERPTDEQPSRAEQFRQAMGWAQLPEMTPEQRADYDRKNAQAQADAERIYGTNAA